MTDLKFTLVITDPDLRKKEDEILERIAEEQRIIRNCESEIVESTIVKTMRATMEASQRKIQQLNGQRNKLMVEASAMKCLEPIFQQEKAEILGPLGQRVN